MTSSVSALVDPSDSGRRRERKSCVTRRHFPALRVRTSRTTSRAARGASAAPSSAREVIPSFGNTRYRCVLTVRCERNSRWPISRFDRPSAASWAICSSCAVSSSRASGTRRRLRSPDARSSRARLVSPAGRADRVEQVARLAQRRPGLHHAPVAAQPPAVGEQEPAAPERPAIEIRARAPPRSARPLRDRRRRAGRGHGGA